MRKFNDEDIAEALAWAKAAQFDHSYATSGARLLALVDEIEHLRSIRQKLARHADAIERHPTKAPRMDLVELRRLLDS